MTKGRLLFFLFWSLNWNSPTGKPPKAEDLGWFEMRKCSELCTIATKGLQRRGHTGQAEYLDVFLVQSRPSFVTVAVLQQVEQRHGEEGKVHGDPLGHAARRQGSLFWTQREREHIDRVPPGESLLLQESGRYGAREEWDVPRVEITQN